MLPEVAANKRPGGKKVSHPAFERIGTQNIKVHRDAERRYYCTTCEHTFSADEGTFFETWRTDRPLLWDAMARLVERNSLRAISRVKHCAHNTVLHWLHLAGQHAAAVSHHLIHGLHLIQAQIDELWTFVKKKQKHLQPQDPSDSGDAWIWRAITRPRHLRVVTHLSHECREAEATAFLAAFKARTDGRPPLFTSHKLPAYVEALIANYSTPQPPPAKRGPSRPRTTPRRALDPELLYAQVEKHREGGRVVEVRRHIVFGAAEVITEILGDQQINTSYVERDNLTSRQSNGRLVRKTRSYSKKDYYLRRHLDLEDARPEGRFLTSLPSLTMSGECAKTTQRNQPEPEPGN